MEQNNRNKNDTFPLKKLNGWLNPLFKNIPLSPKKDIMNSRIFILDDHYFFCKVMEGMLRNIGFKNIEIFVDEYRCVQSLNKKPDLIFLDHNLKINNGMFVLNKLQELDLSPKVVYMSSRVRVFMQVADHYQGLHFLSKNDLKTSELKTLLYNSVL